MNVGDRGYFGRKNCEKTAGEIVKVNRKTVKVRQTESRGTQKGHGVGNVWIVARTLWTSETSGRPAYSTTRRVPRPVAQRPVAPRPERTEGEILDSLRRVDAALSPENLTGDGELSRREVARRYRAFNAERRALVSDLGRDPTEVELHGVL